MGKNVSRMQARTLGGNLTYNNSNIPPYEWAAQHRFRLGLAKFIGVTPAPGTSESELHEVNDTFRKRAAVCHCDLEARSRDTKAVLE